MALRDWLFATSEPVQERALPEVQFPARLEQTISPDSAVRRLSAVFRCIQVISHTASTLEVERYQGDNYAGRFRGFAEGVTDREFIAETVVSLAGWGNAYWRKPSLKLKAWKYRGVIHPEWITLRLDGTFDVFDPITGKFENLGRDEITHIKFLPVPGALQGIGPLGSLRSTLQFATDLNDYAATVYTDGAYPSGYLSTDQQMPPAISDGIKAKWIEKFAKANREPAILTGGLKYEPLTINPTDAAFVESFNLSIQDIARAFGVPGSFMGVSSGDSLTYSTSESESRRFVTTTLSAYTAPIEQAFSADRGAATDYIEFDFDSLLRADTASRYQAYAAAQIKADGSGWMTREEIRSLEGMPATPSTNGGE